MTDTTTTTTIAGVRASHVSLGMMISASDDAPDIIGSRPVLGIDGARYLLAMTGQSDLTVDDLSGSVFLVRDWLAHRITLEHPETREMQHAIRLVFVDPDGRTLAMASDVAVRDWQMVVSAIGPGPYDEPIGIRVIEARSRKGYRMYTLRIAD